MKKILSLFILMLSPLLASAQTVSDVQNSGCLNETRGEEPQRVPTIVLTKEGSILSVQLLNYDADCCLGGFNVTSNISGGSDGEPSLLSISVQPDELGCDCYCPYNVSFTIRDLETNSFYLKCWWFEGLVELTEGEPFVLEYKTEDVVIDGLRYLLLKTTHQAKLLYQNQWDGESEILQIPSEIEYKGERYTVTSMDGQLFGSNNTIKKIIIPKTIKITSQPFSYCLALETIEVEDGNPDICSVDGVLFNKDITTIIAYPAASPRESYTAPDGVKTAASDAFVNNQHLKRIVMPNNMEALGFNMFGNSKSLEEVILPSNIKVLPSDLFRDCIKLQSVVIPEGVTTIGMSAFEGCVSLGSIALPESVTTVEGAAFTGCTSLKSATLSPNLKEIPVVMFGNCSNLAEVIIPFGITTIGDGAFTNCKAMQSLDLPESINHIGIFAFRYLSNLKDVYCHAETVPNTDYRAFGDVDLSQVTLHVPAASIDNYQSASPWNQFGAIVPLETDMAYRPMIEDGKVWKVGYGSDNPIQFVEYYYFNGDTIIDGRTCKQMMYQRYVTPDYVDYEFFIQHPLLGGCGDWYEEDKKVYVYDNTNKKFQIIYDFSLDAYDTLWLDEHASPFVVGPRQTGGMKGFKGVYRDVFMIWDEEQSIYNTTWLEGVGGIDGPTGNVYYSKNFHSLPFLMSCTVGDEVIYFNDDYEDGATPEVLGARKRFDFTHTIKTHPQAPRRAMGAQASLSAEAEQSLYGEYNNLQLGINLDPLDDAYMVRITDETGTAVYEKTVNAASIVGLNVDISAYAEGRYTVTVENSLEIFTGQFEVETMGISDAKRDNGEMINDIIYNLQGQRISTLQKGLNIVNGQKVIVK